MNKRERVIAAFHRQETDCVPVCMWKHVPREYWEDDDAFVRCQLEAYRNTDVDFVKLSADKYFGWPSPELNGIEKAETLYQLKPLGADHPFIRGQIERTRKIIEGLHGECVALYLIFAPLCYLRLQIGYPMMMKLMREDPEAVKHACGVIAGDVKLLIRGIIEEAGADGIFFSVQNAEEDRFTYEEYREWITPTEKPVLDYANTLSDMNAIHLCAWEGSPNRLSVWADYQAAVVSWSRYIDMMDIQKAKEHFGCTVWGGFDNRSEGLLYTASREELEKEVRSLIDQGGRTGYILGADCSLHDELPEERIRWVVEAARAYKG